MDDLGLLTRLQLESAGVQILPRVVVRGLGARFVNPLPRLMIYTIEQLVNFVGNGVMPAAGFWK